MEQRMSQDLQKLTDLLAELFQLDRSELDFGIYRILNTKQDQIICFLGKDLLPQTQKILSTYEYENYAIIKDELEKAKEQAKALGFNDPAEVPKIKELHTRYKAALNRDYLEDEGLSTKEDCIELVLPVIKSVSDKNLRIVRLKDEIDFKKDGQKPILSGEPPEFLKKYPIILDLYPKLQAMVSGTGQVSVHSTERDRCYFEESHLLFLDWDAIYFELQQFKNERSWYNLIIPRDSIASLLMQKDWYTLYIPKEEMDFCSFQHVRRWHEIVTALLKRYLDRYYKFRKQEFESKYLEYQELSKEDPNLAIKYRIVVEQSLEHILQKLLQIKDLLQSGTPKEADFFRLHFEEDSFKVIAFANHLYQPLIYVSNGLVEVSPVVLQNEGERDFVLDLQKFCQ
jgi:hypothetical protein